MEGREKKPSKSLDWLQDLRQLKTLELSIDIDRWWDLERREQPLVTVAEEVRGTQQPDFLGDQHEDG